MTRDTEPGWQLRKRHKDEIRAFRDGYIHAASFVRWKSENEGLCECARKALQQVAKMLEATVPKQYLSVDDSQP